MPIVILALFIGAVLIPGLEARIETVVEKFGSAVFKGPVSTAVNAWIEVAVIAAGLGFVIWLVETKAAKSMGQEVYAPPVESIHVATPPSFGSQGGYSAGPGGLSVTGGVTTQSGSHSSGGVGAPGRKATARSAPKESPANSKRGAFTG